METDSPANDQTNAGIQTGLLGKHSDPVTEGASMKFVVKKVSDWKFNEEREINTVNDLKKLAEEHPGWHGKGESKDLIINFGWKEHPQPTITIYDDYIE